MATAAQVADDGRYLAFVPISGSYLLGLLRASVSSRITLSNDMNIKIIYLGSLNSVDIRYEFTSLWSGIRMRRHALVRVCLHLLRQHLLNYPQLEVRIRKEP